jgi:hypothetical protein
MRAQSNEPTDLLPRILLTGTGRNRSSYRRGRRYRNVGISAGHKMSGTPRIHAEPCTRRGYARAAACALFLAPVRVRKQSDMVIFWISSESPGRLTLIDANLNHFKIFFASYLTNLFCSGRSDANHFAHEMLRFHPRVASAWNMLYNIGSPTHVRHLTTEWALSILQKFRDHHYICFFRAILACS